MWVGFDFSNKHFWFLNQNNNGLVETSMEDYAINKEMVERDKGKTKGRSEASES